MALDNAPCAPIIPQDALSVAGRLILPLYDGHQFSNLNELQAHLYCSRDIKDLRFMPPTEDAFIQHMLRFFGSHVQVPSLMYYGWKLEEGCLKPKYMTQPHSPPNLKKIHYVAVRKDVA